MKDEMLRRLSAKSRMAAVRGVLDLGAGAGLWHTHAETLAIRLVPWIAVEVFGPNIQRFRLRERYDTVRHIDFRRIKFSRYSGHAFIFGDVLEHLSADDARNVVLRAASAGTVVIVMPFVPSTSAEQGAVDGNEAERHLHVWKWQEFLEAIGPAITGFGHDIEIVKRPDGTGRNKGGLILWHPSHAGASR